MHERRHQPGAALMARAFGRILTRIWDDKDFLALGPGPQRLYCFLVTQANLNHAGLLPLTLRKWSNKAAGLTAEQIRTDLIALDAARFVVMDEDTEELLVRTFIRNDDVYKQPRVMGAAVSGAMEIESHRLRRALLAEVARIPLNELSGEPTKLKDGSPNGPSIRVQIAARIDELCTAFANLDPEPEPPVEEPWEEAPEGDLEGVAEPLSEGVTEGVLEGVVLPPGEPLPEPPAEGGPQGSTRVGAGPRAHTPPLQPSPTTRALPIPFGASGGGGKPPRTGPALAVIEGGANSTPQTTEELIADWIDHVPNRPPGQIIGRVGKAVKALLAEGVDPIHVRSGIAAWARKGADPSALPSFVNQAMNASPPPTAGPRNPSPTDDTEAWLARFEQRAAGRGSA